MTEHTPAPWAAEIDYGNARVVATDHKGTFPICDIRGWGHLTGKGVGALGLSEAEGIAIQNANAVFIVKAVNAHDALVKVLEEAIPLLETLHSLLPMGEARRFAFTKIKNARAALEGCGDSVGSSGERGK